MTEGNLIIALNISHAKHKISTVIPFCRVTPGARVLVCKPRSQKVVKRGEVGELHIGGLHVSRGYIDRTTPDFYREDGINWFVTGDQARVDEDGVVYIVGSHQELIVRMGENLSPAAIERCLDPIKSIGDSQVIGIPDEIAGDVPMAVIKKAAGLTPSNLEIQQKVPRELGKIFVPQSIVDLHKDLSLEDYPRTLSGEVKKHELPAPIAARVSAKEGASSDVSSACSVETLIRFWAQITGRKAEEISPEEHADTFADSIIMLQFCNLVSKALHKTIAVEDLIGGIDISKQADIINARPTTQHKVYQQPAIVFH